MRTTLRFLACILIVTVAALLLSGTAGAQEYHSWEYATLLADDIGGALTPCPEFVNSVGEVVGCFKYDSGLTTVRYLFDGAANNRANMHAIGSWGQIDPASQAITKVWLVDNTDMMLVSLVPFSPSLTLILVIAIRV